MKYKTFASTGEKLSAIGSGCMSMSHAYEIPMMNPSKRYILLYNFEELPMAQAV